MFVAIGTLLLGLGSAFGQNQEQKLIDRLLRPNMTMKNAAQDKKFGNARTNSLEKSAPTRSFYAPRKSVSRSFPEERAFTPQQFAARHFRGGDSAANVSTRTQLRKDDALLAMPTSSPGTRVAPEAAQVATTSSTREYAGNRPFLVEGKSQKSLRAHDRPLTIEQVRELLNKSK